MASIPELKGLLKDWVNHTKPAVRWPCPECGRQTAFDNKRTLTVTTEDNRISIEGCHLCNMEWLIIQSEEAIYE